MATDYDEISEQYKRSKQIPWRYHIEQYSLCELLGDISGYAVLDLACGDGHYTRMAKGMGASRVVGVDLSAKMIELATASEQRQPLGIEYGVGDARAIGYTAEFDLVIAAYLLNYAPSEQDLLAMASAIHRSLKPRGRFITINNNPAQQPRTFENTRKYGFVKNVDGEVKNGSPIRYTFIQHNEEFVLENYHLDSNTHIEVLGQAGFSDVQWHLPRLSPAESEKNSEYWADFLADPAVALISCSKHESMLTRSATLCIGGSDRFR
jgi:ubiquinone/menaquinone biosynthesis C-methylase UbiE